MEALQAGGRRIHARASSGGSGSAPSATHKLPRCLAAVLHMLHRKTAKAAGRCQSCVGEHGEVPRKSPSLPCMLWHRSAAPSGRSPSMQLSAASPQWLQAPSWAVFGMSRGQSQGPGSPGDTWGVCRSSHTQTQWGGIHAGTPHHGNSVRALTKGDTPTRSAACVPPGCTWLALRSRSRSRRLRRPAPAAGRGPPSSPLDSCPARRSRS